MGFLKKLFGGGSKTTDKREEKIVEQTPQPQQQSFARDDEDFEPESLSALLEKWSRQESEETYQTILDELTNGSSFLLLPSINDIHDESHEWTTIEGNDTDIESVYEVEGFRVLMAFSDPKSIKDWAEKEIQYKSLPAQEVLEFAEKHNINSIVINSGLLNMFIMERNRDNVHETAMEEETPVRVGIPATPLSDEVVSRLVQHFENIAPVDSAYQYVQEMGESHTLIIGVRLTSDSELARTAMIDAVNSSLQGSEKHAMPIGIMLLDDKWLATMESIDNQPFFQR